MKTREFFRRVRRILKSNPGLAALRKEFRARIAAARKSFERARRKLRPPLNALAKRTRGRRAAARRSLEPIARRIAPAWKAVAQRARHRPGSAALVAAVVAATAFAALGGARFGRVLLAQGRIAPLPAEVRRAAHEQAERLAAALDARLDKKRRLAGVAGVSARILIALAEGDAHCASASLARTAEKFFRSVAGPECLCWRKLPDSRYPDDVGVTAWVLWALSDYGIPAHKGEIEFLLSSQMRSGAWPQFSAAKQDRFASTYATAAAIVGLAAQSGLQPDRARSERMRQAMERGAAWLRSGAGPSGASWTDYPAWPDASEQKRLAGVSGFALFALHRAGAPDLAALDRDWIRNLPADLPADDGEASGKPVRIGRHSYQDDTPHYALPWMVLATVFAYPNGSLFDKVAATRWLEGRLAPGLVLYDVAGSKDAAAAAETLFALRAYPEVADSQTTGGS